MVVGPTSQWCNRATFDMKFRCLFVANAHKPVPDSEGSLVQREQLCSNCGKKNHARQVFVKKWEGGLCCFDYKFCPLQFARLKWSESGDGGGGVSQRKGGGGWQWRACGREGEKESMQLSVIHLWGRRGETTTERRKEDASSRKEEDFPNLSLQSFTCSSVSEAQQLKAELPPLSDKFIFSFQRKRRGKKKKSLLVHQRQN